MLSLFHDDDGSICVCVCVCDYIYSCCSHSSCEKEQKQKLISQSTTAQVAPTCRAGSGQENRLTRLKLRLEFCLSAWPTLCGYFNVLHSMFLLKVMQHASLQGQRGQRRCFSLSTLVYFCCLMWPIVRDVKARAHNAVGNPFTKNNFDLSVTKKRKDMTWQREL